MEDDYESLPSSSSTTAHMIAGAAAGMMEHCVMYPVDSVKTRMQCICPDPRANYTSTFDAFRQIIKNEGFRYTVRGINAVVAGAVPAHALYFACYEKAKATLSASHNRDLSHGLAGVGATLVHDAVMNPADVVKQRMQVFGSPFRSCTDCALTVFRHEGIMAFYRSYATQLGMNIPYHSIHFMTYERSEDFFNPNRTYNAKSHMLSGALAGGLAGGVTNPLDVVKTLLNTQEKCVANPVEGCILKQQSATRIRGFFHAVTIIYSQKGYLGFTKGLQARILQQMPATAISWTVYEFFKYYLYKRNNQDSFS